MFPAPYPHGHPDWAVSALVAVAGASAAVGLAAEVGRRRSRSHLRRRLGVSPPPARRAPGERLAAGLRAADDAAGRVGGVMRHLGRRPPSESADRRLGRAVLAAGVTLAVASWPVAVLVGGVVAGLPGLWARRADQRFSVAVEDGLPEVLDVLRVSVEAGLDVAGALVTVADHQGAGPLADALRNIDQRIGRGDRLLDTLVEVEVLGEPVRNLHAALVATLRHGVPLAPALERAADEARDTRRRREAVRTLPVKLLFPLVFCTLPALVLLTVVPLLMRSFPSLAP